VTEVEIETPHGPARAHIHGKRGTAGALVLGHGAGGGVSARDLVAATDAALAAGLRVVLVEQPYRVAGRRSPAPAAQLDAAWQAVVTVLRRRRLIAGDLIVGGRSAGARVACRTAADTGAVAVLCLAFPLHPPGRPEKSRLNELEAVTVPTLVVQGESDPFGMPPAGPGRTVVRVKGNHSLSGDIAAVRAAVGDWVAQLASPATRIGAPAAR
jgi:predicted alpha/beta-hydrolase family hydrolase